MARHDMLRAMSKERSSTAATYVGPYASSESQASELPAKYPVHFASTPIENVGKAIEDFEIEGEGATENRQEEESNNMNGKGMERAPSGEEVQDFEVSCLLLNSLGVLLAANLPNPCHKLDQVLI